MVQWGPLSKQSVSNKSKTGSIFKLKLASASKDEQWADQLQICILIKIMWRPIHHWTLTAATFWSSFFKNVHRTMARACIIKHNFAFRWKRWFTIKANRLPLIMLNWKQWSCFLTLSMLSPFKMFFMSIFHSKHFLLEPSLVSTRNFRTALNVKIHKNYPPKSEFERPPTFGHLKFVRFILKIAICTNWWKAIASQRC